MQSMQEMIQQEGNVGPLPDHIDLTSDFGMEEAEESPEPAVAPKKRGSPMQRSFRAATSPSKVANQHLKQKAQDAKDNKIKQNEEK